MAWEHCGKEWVISIDIKDYFTSIKQRHVLAAFADFGIVEWAGKLLSEIVTFKAFLPQGAVTSPKVSNMIAAKTFGPVINDICDSLGIVLTIYADDLTFSYDYTDVLYECVHEEYLKWFPEDTTEFPTSGKGVSTMLIRIIDNILHTNGFLVNRKKTKVMGPGLRHWVCGVVTNKHPNLSKKQRSFLRAVVHNMVTHGVQSAAERAGVDPHTFVYSLRGKLAWYKQINPSAAQPLIDKYAAYLKANPL